MALFSDSLDREAAWLNTVNDGLPNLPTSGGGPFQIIQARWPRAQATTKTGIYVMRQPGAAYKIDRFAAIRSMPTTRFQLRLWWPLTTSGTGSAEANQKAFEQAIDSLITRLEDLIGDKTHGGRFLAAGEGPEGIQVTNYDPVRDIETGRLTADVLFTADDPDFPN